MKILTKYQLSCNGYMVSELGQTRIKLYEEHNVFHIVSTNVLGSGQVWESTTSFKLAIDKFKKLRKIQQGNFILTNYEVLK